MQHKKTIIAGISLLVVIIIVIIFGKSYYDKIWDTNVTKDGFLYIPNNSNFESVCDSLTKNNFLEDINSFKWVAKQKKYDTNVKAGKYEIKKDMSNSSLVNLLRSGKQTRVIITFNNIKNLDIFAGKISKKIEADSASLSELFSNSDFIDKYGFDKNNVIAMFIPNTYEFYWNTSPRKFFEIMNNYYKDFWTDNRIQKTKNIGLNKIEVSTLASIVQAEQAMRNDEKPIIAGLYINRLKKGMLLQSDPTILFALNNFEKKRVLNTDKEVESPYNTYKYAGLPPGPINMPEISSIDAVLNFKKHNYIFMCAKEDFSGYHYFSTNARQHEIYANRYRRALNKKRIWK